MTRRRGLAVVLAVGLVIGFGMPADATHPIDPAHPEQIFGLAVVEGPGDITSALNGTTVYNEADPLWVQCKAALQALGVEGLPAPLNGGVFFPCFGPPITSATTHFRGAGIGNPDPVNAASFCASTLGPCETESNGAITGNIVGDVQAGAYCGSSRGVADGSFATIGSPFGDVSYSYHVEWAQSGATVLPLTGVITSGPGTGATIVGFVSARTTNDSRGTCGRPSASQPASGQITFVVDGMTVSF